MRNGGRGGEGEGDSKESDIADESHFLAEGRKEERGKERSGQCFTLAKVRSGSGGKENDHSVHKHGCTAAASTAFPRCSEIVALRITYNLAIMLIIMVRSSFLVLSHHLMNVLIV